MIKGKEGTKRTMKHSCIAHFADLFMKMKEFATCSDVPLKYFTPGITVIKLP